MSMFVITLFQPYAQLIALGLKRYEFKVKRPGRDKWGKKIGIHAAATMASDYDVRKTIATIEEHGPGVLGITKRDESLKVLNRSLDDPKSFHLSRIIATAKMRVPVKVKDILKQGNPAGFNLDLWALPLANIKELSRSVPATGHSTIWWYEGTLKNGGKG